MMKLLSRLAAPGLVLTFAGSLIGCGNNSPQPADTGATTATGTMGATTLNGAGATFPYPLYSKWFDQYNQERGVRINYQAMGSGAGVKQLTNGTVDFGASDSPVKDAEEKAMSGEIVHFPTVAGAVVVVYNVTGANSGLRLTGETLADIFLGKIQKWNDPKIVALNVGTPLPDLPIVVVHRSDGSGTTAIFTDYLDEVSKTWNARVGDGKSVSWPVGIGAKGNDGVAGVVKTKPGAIGYVELAYARQNRLAFASLRNKRGEFVAPSVAATTAAAEGELDEVREDIKDSIVNSDGKGAYPIAAFTYLIVYKTAKDSAKGQAVADFLMWAMKDGQKQAAALDYAPLPDALIQLNQKRIAGLK